MLSWSAVPCVCVCVCDHLPPSVSLCMPLTPLGVFMRDLTFFNDGNHKTLKNGLINFSKLRTMVLKVGAFYAMNVLHTLQGYLGAPGLFVFIYDPPPPSFLPTTQFYDLKRYQRSKYFFPPEDKTRDFCRNLWCMSEHE